MSVTRSPLNVLVTAIHGDLGQAVAKALRLSRPGMLAGCDLSADGVGQAFVARFDVVPKASDPAYVGAIDALCRARRIDAVIPASEPEIMAWARAGHATPSGVPVICQDAAFLDRYGDKLACMQTLDGVVALTPYADGADAEAVDRLVQASGFPVVVKERRSSGSKGVTVVHTKDALQHAIETFDQPLVQAFIDDAAGEFSVGVFCTEGETRTISFRRALGPGGGSWFAEKDDDADVLAYARAIAEATGTRGSFNVQVRKSSDGVRLLEINPRFSSLAAARAACGFCDVDWSVSLACGEALGPLPPMAATFAFRRYLGEVVDFGQGFGRMPAWDLPPVG
jgi:carbamoyl-phosphate synthase large subunit